MKKTFILGVILLAVAAVGVFWLGNGREADDSSSASTPVPTPTPVVPSAAEETAVVYTDAGYAPDTVRIKAGDTVIFQNNSSRSIWPASGMHPTHEVYPVKGGCISSSFDACKGIKSGELWSFKFDVAGKWGYHDHLNPSHRGLVIAE